jgi:hypothetical protein
MSETTMPTVLTRQTCEMHGEWFLAGRPWPICPWCVKLTAEADLQRVGEALKVGSLRGAGDQAFIEVIPDAANADIVNSGGPFRVLDDAWSFAGPVSIRTIRDVARVVEGDPLG